MSLNCLIRGTTPSVTATPRAPKSEVVTTRPIGGGLKRNGAPKTNGVPVSPADKARNGNGNGKPRGNGAPVRTPQRPAIGTKSVFRERTAQRQELDSQSSSPNKQWFYFLGL